ncbi:hypothetical protein CAEBREN_06544 [Caenorhabditis brenneri]|uniref:Uncharacterized protein n=1 Tax=Caenorhabditis brenneri TaxID=135651 RepID=G0MLS3_CAEBE|nr:hypothetical protein CAEBREN_06544 [Caenorhabditis brenneri]
MSSIIATSATPMLTAFQRIISDLKCSTNMESGLKSLVMMRFNLSMATDAGLKTLLESIPTTDDDNLEQLKNIVVSKIECMEYVDDAKKENALKTRKRAATNDSNMSEPVAKRPCLPVAPIQKRPIAPPSKQIDDDFFCRKRTAPMKTAPKPKAPLMPFQPLTTVAATARPQSTTNSLDLMKKCKEIRLAKLEKQKIVNQQKVQDNISWLETFRMQRIKEQQDRNKGIVAKVEKKNRRMH